MSIFLGKEKSMEYVIIALTLLVSVSLLNVWLVQPKKATPWRGGNATTLREEFKVYGLPEGMFYLVGILKVSFAVLLIVGIWYPMIRHYAAIGLALLLLGSIVMHIKISDPLKKSLPAFIFLVCCLVIAFGGYH